MSAVKIFDYAGQQVRTFLTDGEPWFIAADVLAILELDRTAVRRLDDDERGVRSMHTRGGAQDVSIVSEAGLYRLVLGSRKPEVRDFKRWVTHEVLPSIRKTGAYSVAPALPQDYASALRALAAEVEDRAALEAKVASDAPKVLFADAVATAQTDILVGDLAKILRGNGLDIGGTRLFALLRDEGYLIKRDGSDRNMPTQKSMDLGLFRIKETAVTHSDGHVTIQKTPKVTGRGQAYFVKRYLTEAVAA